MLKCILKTSICQTTERSCNFQHSATINNSQHRTSFPIIIQPRWRVCVRFSTVTQTLFSYKVCLGASEQHQRTLTEMQHSLQFNFHGSIRSLDYKQHNILDKQYAQYKEGLYNVLNTVNSGMLAWFYFCAKDILKGGFKFANMLCISKK